MKWSEVTLNQFLELQQIMKIEDDTDKMLSVAELFFGEDVTDLPIPEFNKKMKELDFLQEEVPNNHIVNKVTINNRDYTIDALLGHISTAQYVDFTNYMKEENKIAQVLSVFFIPKGHKYNDGYDMEEVIRDMGSLPVDIAMSESFFFSRQFARFIKIFQSYSIKQLKKTDLPKKAKKKLIKAVEDSVDLVLSHSSLSSAK